MCSPWQSKLKFNYTMNPRFGASQPFSKSIKDARKKNKERNPIRSNFTWLCEIFACYAKFKRRASVGKL